MTPDPEMDDSCRNFVHMSSLTLFLDCDDTLYANGWTTANGITALIESYCTGTLGLAPGRACVSAHGVRARRAISARSCRCCAHAACPASPIARRYELYKAHGTCLAGLIAESIPVDVEAFLAAVHPTKSVLAATISAKPALRAMLERIDRSRVEVFVFTASSSQHCANCLSLLGVHDLLVDAAHPIIDCRAVAQYGASGDPNDVLFRTKHDPEAFAAAQRLAGQPDASRCYLVDDSWSNIRRAAACGWHPVLIGHTARDGSDAATLVEKEHVISDVLGLEAALPQFFARAGAAQ